MQSRMKMAEKASPDSREKCELQGWGGVSAASQTSVVVGEKRQGLFPGVSALTQAWASFRHAWGRFLSPADRCVGTKTQREGMFLGRCQRERENVPSLNEPDFSTQLLFPPPFPRGAPEGRGSSGIELGVIPSSSACSVALSKLRSEL